jgi:hypothetical protein
MATFTNFNDRLPDPTFGVSDAGSVDAAGEYGPGFANVTFRNNRPVQSSRTISGRGIQTETGAQNWEIDINYHPMGREDFDVVAAFLDSWNGKLNPFYVVLPQYSKPKNATFATFATNNVIRANGAHAAGLSYINIDALINFTGTPRPGDFFTINDGADSAHKKAYKVTRVETNALYQAGQAQPFLNQLRVHIHPPLVRTVSDNSIINWINPQFRVIQKSDVLEYQLNTDNLWQFQLSLEEIQV